MVDGGQAAALEDEDAVGRLGEHAARRTALVARAADVFRPVGHDLIGTRDVVAALFLLRKTDGRPRALPLRLPAGAWASMFSVVPHPVAARSAVTSNKRFRMFSPPSA